jgi:hypothetical protein
MDWGLVTGECFLCNLVAKVGTVFQAKTVDGVVSIITTVTVVTSALWLPKSEPCPKLKQWLRLYF